MPRESKEKKEKLITRTVVTSMTFDVYGFKDGQTTKVDTITVPKRPTPAEEKKLAENHGVTAVILQLVDTDSKLMSITESQFMAVAVEVKEKTETTENTESEEV